MITMYGLARCDTCRKARAWLDENGVEHRFVDYRESPLSAAELQRHAAQLGWEKLVNRASTTWRQLPEARKSPAGEADWLALVGEHPTLIRRPLLVRADGTAMVGFSADRYSEAFR
jgi:Spx/MgsR family transcriptional regulator